MSDGATSFPFLFGYLTVLAADLNVNSPLGHAVKDKVGRPVVVDLVLIHFDTRYFLNFRQQKIDKFPKSSYYVNMNINQSFDLLYFWFLNKDTFCLETNLKELIDATKVLQNQPKNVIEASIFLALEEYKTLGYIKEITIEKKRIFVLVKHLASYSHKISVSPEATKQIWTILQRYSIVTEQPQITPSFLDITEQNILHLCVLADNFVKTFENPPEKPIDTTPKNT